MLLDDATAEVGMSLPFRSLQTNSPVFRFHEGGFASHRRNAMLERVLVITVALLLFGSSAVAQGAAKSCAADIKTHCAGEEPGEGRIAGCVKKHLGDLSAPCQDLLAKTAAAAKVCTDDVKQRCADKRRRAAKLVCIKSALTSLSDDCKSAISQVAAGRK